MFYVAFQMVCHEAFVKCEIEGGGGVGRDPVLRVLLLGRGLV